MTLSRHRRIAPRHVQGTQQLLVFNIRHESFALPIQFAHRVIPMGAVYGTHESGGVGLTRYNNQDVLVIDAARRIFGELSSQPLLLNANPNELQNQSQNQSWNQSQLQSQVEPQNESKTESQSTSSAQLNPSGNYASRHLLIIQASPNELIGIPLDAPPNLRRVPDSAFAPIPAAYLAQSKMRCVSALVISAENESPIFLLNPNQLNSQI